MNNWEKLKIIGNLTASILIPIAIVWIGNNYSSTNKDKDLSISYVQIALDILKEPPNENTTEIRNWAIDLLNYHSPSIKMNPKAEMEAKRNRVIVNRINSMLNIPEIGEIAESKILEQALSEVLPYADKGLSVDSINRLVDIAFIGERIEDRIIRTILKNYNSKGNSER